MTLPNINRLKEHQKKAYEEYLKLPNDEQGHVRQVYVNGTWLWVVLKTKRKAEPASRLALFFASMDFRWSYKYAAYYLPSDKDFQFQRPKPFRPFQTGQLQSAFQSKPLVWANPDPVGGGITTEGVYPTSPTPKCRDCKKEREECKCPPPAILQDHETRVKWVRWYRFKHDCTLQVAIKAYQAIYDSTNFNSIQAVASYHMDPNEPVSEEEIRLQNLMKNFLKKEHK